MATAKFPIPKTMRAIIAPAPGGADKLEIVKRAVPKIRADEVLVKVAAAGLNRPDILQREGKYPMPKGAPDVLGLEASGIIVKRGAKVKKWKQGQKVAALLIGGGYAEYAAVPQGQLIAVPTKLSLLEAAGIPETFITVWFNLFMQGALKKGETVLIHGGASGIGTTAIMLARAFGAKVIVTVGDEIKAKACRKLGAHFAINYKTEDFEERARALAPKGVDIILDMVAGDYFPKNVRLLAEGGRLVQIATQRGADVQLDIRQMMRKRLLITGSMLRPQSTAQKAAIIADFMKRAGKLLASAKARPLIHKVFLFEKVREAHKALEEGTHIGKIILSIQ